MLSKNKILKFVFIIMIATFLSKVLGLFREMYALHLFGGGLERDAFTSALRIPNAMRELLAEGAFSAAFITLFSQILVRHGEKKAFIFANKIINLSLIVSVIVVGISLLLADLIISIFHSGPPPTEDLAITMFRIIFPFLIFLSLASMMMGILNSKDHFIAPSLSPFFSNVVFILVLFFASVWVQNLSIHYLAIAVLLGGLAQFIIQFPVAIKKGWRYKADFKFNDPMVKDFARLFIPMAAAMGIPKLINILSNPFATFFEGTNTAIYYSFLMVQLILSVFIQGISVISLPQLSKFYSMQDWIGFRGMVSNGIRLVLFFAIPSVLFLMILSNELSYFLWNDIWMLFTGGSISKAGPEVFNRIGTALFYFAPAIITMGINVIALRAYQAIKSMKYPIIFGLLAVGQHLATIFILWEIYGLDFNTENITNQVYALNASKILAISFTLSSLTQSILLFTYLMITIKGLIWRPFLDGVARITIAAVGSGIFTLIGKRYLISMELFPFDHLNGIFNISAILFIAVCIYFLLMVLLRDDEVLRLFNQLKAKLKKNPIK